MDTNAAAAAATNTKHMATQSFSTMSVATSDTIMDASTISDVDATDSQAAVAAASTIPLSYDMSSGHVPLAARSDGLVIVVAVTESQFFALTYLLDTLRTAHAQVIVYDMGIPSSHAHTSPY